MHKSIEHSRYTVSYRWFILFILMIVGTFNFIDRNIVYILIEPIKNDLHISDTEVGLLTGAGFALVYAVSGLWIARIADTKPRNLVIGAAVLVWSTMTALGGLAQSFFQLFISRLGVAAGEAGASPAAHSLLNDVFPPSQRSLAISLFGAATPLGVMIGYVVGGWIANHFDWRSALIGAGLMGIPIGLLVILVVRDRRPPVEASDRHRGAIKALLTMPVFRHMIAATGVLGGASYALAAFQPSFLIRVHHFDTVHAGFVLGIVHGLGGMTGILLGGVLGDWLGLRDVRWRQWVAAGGTLLAAPFTLVALFMENGEAAAWLMLGPAVCNLVFFGPTFGLAQSIAPVWARATATAMLMFGMSMIGQATGPLLVGMISDALTEEHGRLAIRYALLLVPMLQVWAALHFWLAARQLSGRPGAEVSESEGKLP